MSGGSRSTRNAALYAGLVAAMATGGCYEGSSGDDDDPVRVPGAAEDGAGEGGDAGDDDDDADDDDDDSAGACEGLPSVAPRALRRLTPAQYQNTLRDLLGDAELETEYDDLEPVLTERGTRQLRSGAEDAIARIDQWTPGLVPCSITAAEDATCPTAVLDTLAPLAFRRPLTDAERDWLTAVYEETVEEHDFRSGMEALLGTILQAPAFVYHEEIGTPVEGADEDLRALTDYELASRLSYLLWDSMPDEALFDAAEAGELSDPEGLQTQAERMAADPRAREKMQRFLWSWLQLDGGRAHFALGEQTKSPDLFPEYTPQLVDAMGVELRAFVDRVVYEEGGELDQLFLSTDAYVNASLADIYVAQGGPMDDETFAWVQLGNARAGVLTRLAFLSTFAGPDVQSPIRRGVFVYEQLLCGHLGDPPPNASDVPVEGGEVDGEVLSVREEVELRTSGPDCSGCHDLINNIGFSFENFDALGRWRSIELTSGRFVDSSGEMLGSDVDGPLSDAVDLSRRLADSEMVERCFADRWIEQAIGEAPGLEDACAVDHIRQTFSESGRIADLMVAIATSDTFRYIDIGDDDEDDGADGEGE